MDANHALTIWALLIASLAFCVTAVGVVAGKMIQTLRSSDCKSRSGISRIMIFSFFLILSVWALRLAVGLYIMHYPIEGEVPLAVGEEIFNSLIHALQTFSMDEDYTAYIINGKTMVAHLTYEGSAWVGFYGIYASLLNMAAPIAGGAVIFEILANVFPKVKLWLSYPMFWRDKCYFSELNPCSLALAASLRADEKSWFKKPVIIFTDVYVDDENERSSELMLEAKLLGGICIRDDLSHVWKGGWGTKWYYLVDENEVQNLKTFAELTSGGSCKCIKRSKIVFLTQNDAYTQLERDLRFRLEKQFGFKSEEMPQIMPVKGYRNLVTNLLVELPLYEPVVGQLKKNGKTQLNVTILGNGTIGTEMFLAVYWMGQMLNCTLNVNVVSKDTTEEFWEKMDFINPEIRRTVRYEGGPEKEELLRYNRSGGNSPPYCTVRYIQADIKTGAFCQMASEQTRDLLNTDYFVVALGSDEDNIAVAEHICRSVGHEHIKSPGQRKTVIAYVVYNSVLCENLNAKPHHCSWDTEEPDIYMYAFGSLKQVYSRSNILMTCHALMAEAAGEAYLDTQRKTDLEQDYTSRASNAREYDNTNYTYWANLARAMHIKYKVFSAGWIRTSVFDSCDPGSTAHREAVVAAVAQYKRIAINITEPGDEERARELEEKKEELAWLEHRRWNAYTRICGFRHTEHYANYFERTGSHKHMSLKLHPCLVECTCLGTPESEEPDLLDELAYDLEQLNRRKVDREEPDPAKRKYKEYDFREYDYPVLEYGYYRELKEAAQLLGEDPQVLAKRCRSGQINGAFQLTYSQKWAIPLSYIDAQREKKGLSRVPVPRSEKPKRTAMCADRKSVNIS